MSLFSMDQSAGAITAGTTQTFAGATPVLTDFTYVTVGTAADGVVLPTVAPGKVIILKNAGANAGKVYVENGGTLDGTAGATGVAGSLTASVAVAYVGVGYVAGTVGQATAYRRVGAFAA